MITSRDNPKVKWMASLRDKKGRREEGCFLVEGAILVADALDSAMTPRHVLYDSAALAATARGRALLQRVAGAHADEVGAAVLQSVCDTVSPQGIVAAFAIPPAPETLPAEGLVVVLDGLRDPGNVGSLLRSAQAAGCAAVVATPDTADLYSPKVVRAAMGAHVHGQVLEAPWERLTALLHGRAIYLAEAGAGQPYYEIDWTRPTALVIGNETEGPRPEAQRCATGRVSIPMPGRAESLNAAVAASIIIFESVRQRLCLHKGV